MRNRFHSEQEFLKELDKVLEASFKDEKFGVSELAKEMNLSRASLHRRINLSAKISTSQYIKQFRLKKAKKLLLDTSDTVSQIAYKVGFNSVSYFIKCFHDFYGYPPGNFENEQEVSLKVSPSFKITNKKFLFISTFLLIVMAVIFYFISNPFTFHHKEINKTIAVLPFIDDSPQEGNAYIINGLMEEILNKLQEIKDLKVKSRTDSEKYRNSKKSSAEIAKELNVNYILEGSGQKINNRIMLRLQLIEAKTGNHLWSNPYEKEITEENIFSLQQDVALSVANELKAQISNEEESLIGEFPTENKAAYHQYLKGLEHLRLQQIAQKRSDYSESNAQVRKSKVCFEKAVSLDSTFSEAFEQLGHVFTNCLYYDFLDKPRLLVLCMDSGYYYSKKALEFNPDNLGAMSHLIKYYARNGMYKKAIETEKKWMKQSRDIDELYNIYMQKSSFHYDRKEYYEAIKYHHKYVESKPSNQLVPLYMLQHNYNCYEAYGFPQIAKKVAQEILSRDNDSIGYWMKMDMLNFRCDSNYDLTYVKKWYNKDSSHIWVLNRLSWHAMNQRKFKEALEFLKQSHYIKGIPREGFIYQQNGYHKKANKVFEEGINKYLLELELGVPNAQYFLTHSDLINIYSALGQKEKALEYLLQTKKRKAFTIHRIQELRNGPMLDNIRDEPEFQEVLALAEAKYQKEHNRIEKLLRDIGEIE